MSFYDKILEKVKNMNCIHKERGAIFVLTALLLPIMFGCLGIAYDVGTLYMHKARLQNVADAAALAGGRAYIQSQTKTNENDRDKVDGTMDYRSKEIVNCTYKTGRITDGGKDIVYEYRFGNRQAIDRGVLTKHPDADAAADNYIYDNIVNLGNTVYADKYSHFALNYGNATSKIFYRVGLYETVPLRFLPVITDKYSETVRAGAIAYVEPGGTVSTEGGLKINTDSLGSVFDNLITYEKSLNMRHTSQYDVGSQTFTVNASFNGDIVYTHLNGLTDEGEASATGFYQHTINDGDVESSNHNHLVKNTTTIDDPIINTIYDTKAYLWAFRSKLLKYKHYDITQKQFTVPATMPNVSNQQSCHYYKIEENGREYFYLKNGSKIYDRFYYDSDGEPQLSYVNKDGEQYQICYYSYPVGEYNTSDFVLCGMKKGDSKFYLLKLTGDNTYEVTDKYIGEKIIEEDIVHNEWYTEHKRTWTAIKNIELDDIKNAGIYSVKNNSNMSGVTISNSEDGQDIYHVSGELLPDTNVDITISSELNGDVNKPIYIILDADVVQALHFTSDAETTRRPVIFVYCGSSRLDCYFNGYKFIGSVYAPNSYVEVNPISTEFEGNFIVKDFLYQPQASTKSKWTAVNHLKNDTEVNSVTNAMQNSIKDNETTINNLLKDTESNSDLIDQISERLGIDKSNLANMDYYMNLTLTDKKQLYKNWKSFYEDPNTPDNIKNLLWPFNGLFTMTQSSSEGGSENTDEHLRLINFRTEYRENGDPNAVVDPFIYLTLGNPLAY